MNLKVFVIVFILISNFLNRTFVFSAIDIYIIFVQAMKQSYPFAGQQKDSESLIRQILD